MEWTKEEILDHINTNGFFAAFNLNRISGLIGLEIYISLLLPKREIVGLLLYITLKEELDETSDEDKTQVDSGNRQVDSSGNRQVDSGGNRQVDSGGNQDQANDQENAISPQASKDDPLPNLPTPATTTAPPIQPPSVQPPPVQAPSAQAPSIKAPSIQAPSTQAPPPQAPFVQAPPIQAPPAQAPLAQAPPALPSSLTKAKELRQLNSYEPPQPTQQSLPMATTSTPPPLHID